MNVESSIGLGLFQWKFVRVWVVEQPVIEWLWCFPAACMSNLECLPKIFWSNEHVHIAMKSRAGLRVRELGQGETFVQDWFDARRVPSSDHLEDFLLDQFVSGPCRNERGFAGCFERMTRWQDRVRPRFKPAGSQDLECWDRLEVTAQEPLKVDLGVARGGCDVGWAGCGHGCVGSVPVACLDSAAKKHTALHGQSVTIVGMNYRHNPSVVVTDLDDELVLLDPVSKQMFSLNLVGRLLWLELPRQGLDGVLEQITKSFAVSPEQARADAIGLIESLTRSKLLELIDPVTDSGTLEVTDSGTLEVM
jgi:Coenzyme PQQ synthesis protein D (PqqD)